MATTAVQAPQAAPDPPTAAPAARSNRLRPSGGHLLIGLAALTAVVANYAALRSLDATVPVVTAVEAVTAGAAVGAEAFAVTEVRAPDALLATLVTPAELDELVGHVAVHDLEPGDPLRASDLRRPAAPDGSRAMSLPIPAEHAVGGRLVAGDRVDVIAVRDGRAAYLVTAAPVLAVPDGDVRAGLGALQAFAVTLAVDDAEALRLAAALRTGDLEVIRSTGAPPVAAATSGPAEGPVGAREQARPERDRWAGR